jgi:hypothetical protein
MRKRKHRQNHCVNLIRAARAKQLRRTAREVVQEIEWEFYPVPCDGSCLVRQELSEQIPCQEGEPLRFYFCKHQREHILTTYQPSLNLSLQEDDDCPY